jgi:fructose-1,6-bisphosphatase/inositol monophosphatase family enzyme
VVAPAVDVDSTSAMLVEVCERVMMPRFRALGGADVWDKGVDDLVTVADTETLVTEVLRSRFPGKDLDELETYWLLDPLDGTANFVAGRPDFGTMLALVHGGEPDLAWLWLPVRGLLLTA